ncbi:MAG: hypothetical protein GW900_04085 [Gammaproteobacteria bacterium]|nr:hypothetical protein [Gammaproteobacteria bacterium]
MQRHAREWPYPARPGDGSGAAIDETTESLSCNRDKRIAAVQHSIAEQWQQDQIARVAYVRLQTELRTGPEFRAQRLATAETVRIDQQSSTLMHLTEWDWVDRARFGPRVSDFAWLLVQHADHDPPLQSLVLRRMQAYLAYGGIKPAKLDLDQMAAGVCGPTASTANP